MEPLSPSFPSSWILVPAGHLRIYKFPSEFKWGDHLAPWNGWSPYVQPLKTRNSTFDDSQIEDTCTVWNSQLKIGNKISWSSFLTKHSLGIGRFLKKFPCQFFSFGHLRILRLKFSILSSSNRLTFLHYKAHFLLLSLSDSEHQRKNDLFNEPGTVNRHKHISVLR